MPEWAPRGPNYQTFLGNPLLLDMPKRLREEWKQVSERPMLTTHCGVCKRAVSKATDTVEGAS